LTRTFLERLAPWQFYGLLGLIAMAVTLPGLNALPVLDRDEARFAQATAQMIETGDYVTIRFQDTERNKKPVGIHWLQAAAVQAFSHGNSREIWAYRLPSMLGVWLAMVGTALMGTTLFDRGTGFVAALLLGAAPVAMGEATIAKTDAMLLGLITLSQYALIKLVMPAKNGASDAITPWPAALVFWGALAGAILVKGPIAPMILGLTVLALFLANRTGAGMARFDLSARRLKPLAGLAIVGLVVLPWFLAVQEATDGRFVRDALGGDFAAKIARGRESHGAPPGTHLVLTPLLFFPAALFLPLMLTHSWENRRSPSVLFLMAAIIPAWIVFELTVTKLPHYTLPLYPAVGLLTAAALLAPYTPVSGWRTLPGPLLALGLAAGLGAALFVIASLARERGPQHVDGLAAGFTLGMTAVAVRLFARDARLAAALCMAVASFSVSAYLLQWFLPSLDRLTVSPRLTAALSGKTGPEGTGPAILLGYHEPSIVFLLGTDTVLATNTGQAFDRFAADPDASLVVGADHLDEIGNLAAGRNMRLEIGPVVQGLNYSKGDPVALTILRLDRVPRP